MTFPEPAAPAARRAPTREEAEAAVRTLIRWAGDDPDRSGLSGTPERISRMYAELYSGYGEDPAVHLGTTFDEIESYDGLVVVRDIPFVSHSERDMSPFTGLATIAYFPRGRAVGLSKLGRVVDVFARRLQDPARLADEILSAITSTLAATGVAVVLDVLEWKAISGRGRATAMRTVVPRFGGVLEDSPTEQRRVLSLCRLGGHGTARPAR
ncbi:MAG: GTP cyclohydrolase I [Bauldia sp.]